MPAPSENLPEWATDATFPAGADAWSGQPPRVSAGLASLAATGHIPDTPTDAEVFNAWLGLLSEWETYQRVERGAGVYGDGSDGALVLTGSTLVLTRDMYYTDGDIDGTSRLALNGYRVWFNGVCTVDVGGAISANGSDGVIGTVGVDAGGVASPAGSVLGGAVGGTGPAGSLTPGNAGGNTGDAVGGSGGAGGDSNDTPNDVGGAGGVATPPAANDGGWRHLDAALGRLSGASFAQLQGGAGGGAGGSGDAGYGGTGGGGAGVACVWAREIVLNGTIEANGGDGGPGGAGDGGGGGGGGGGGAGGVFLVTRRRSGTGTLVALGGAGGAPETFGGAGVAGAAGFTLQLDA